MNQTTKDTVIAVIVISAFVFVGAGILYGHFGPHKIYNETIAVRGLGSEDNNFYIVDIQYRTFMCRWDDITYEELFDIHPNQLMSVQISENVFGDKSIIKVWRDAFL